MYHSIHSAESSVYLEMYTFINDTKLDFFDLLKDKAQKGIDVKLILDAYGSKNFHKDKVEELKSSGAEVLFLSHRMHKMHRKILVVDEREAYIGGVNIYKGSAKWKDLAVRIHGELVNFIITIFAKDYKRVGGKDSKVLVRHKEVISPKVHEWVFEHMPEAHRFVLQDIYKEHLLKAKEKVFLATPYFAPKNSLINYLHQAVLRGIEVNIIVPEHTESYFLDKVNHFHMNKCVKLGVNFFLVPGMNHAKVMVIDDQEAVVGSQNLDFFSFRLNAEIGVFFEEKQQIQGVKDIMMEWLEQSEPFDPKVHYLNFFEKILAYFLRFLVRFL